MNPVAALFGLVLIVFFFINPCLTVSLLLLGCLVYGYLKSAK